MRPKKGEHIATLLAPKSLVPVAVWLLPQARLGLYTLQGKALVEGHFGEELQDYDEIRDADYLWTRFHTKHLKKVDRGRGLGCAFYLGAALAVRACYEKGRWDVGGQRGIYSDPDDRSDLASRLWQSFHKNGIAQYSTSTIEVWQRHPFKLKGKWTDARLRAYHDKRFNALLSYTTGVRCRGGYTYGEYFYQKSFHYELLDAEDVLYSQRVLALGSFFDSPQVFTPVVPSEFGAADWKGVADDQVADLLWAGATAAASTKKKWLREVFRAWKESRTRLSRILTHLPQKGEIRGDRVVIEGVFPRGIRL